LRLDEKWDWMAHLVHWEQLQGTSVGDKILNMPTPPLLVLSKQLSRDAADERLRVRWLVLGSTGFSQNNSRMTPSVTIVLG
jgi:hypothetical protein